MSINTRIHAILDESEQNIIVQALDFFERYNCGLISADDFEQARLAFREYGRERVADLTLKIATLH